MHHKLAYATAPGAAYVYHRPDRCAVPHMTHHLVLAAACRYVNGADPNRRRASHRSLADAAAATPLQNWDLLQGACTCICEHEHLCVSFWGKMMGSNLPANMLLGPKQV